MSTFDPETGVRLRAEPTSAVSTPRAARNPYELALALIWITAASLAVVLLLAAAGLAGAPDADTGIGGAALRAAGTFAGVALLVGVLHLAVRAIRWRPPEG